MKALSLLLLSSLFGTLTYSQNLTPEVLVNAGGDYSNQYSSISITIGETVTETIRGENNILTQGFLQSHFILANDFFGFQQSSFNIHPVIFNKDTLEKQNFTFKLYPNPVIENLRIEFSQNSENLTVFEMYNLQGVRIYKTDIPKNTNSFSVELGYLKDGLYLIKLSLPEYQQVYITRIEKLTK